VSGKTRLTAALQDAWGRFLLHTEQVEDGDSNGGHCEARGGPIRRRWPESVRLGFRYRAKIEQREGLGRAPARFIGTLRALAVKIGGNRGRGARRRAGALARVDGGQAEDEDFVSRLIPTKGYMGWVGLRYWVASWATAGLLEWTPAGLLRLAWSR
jgi:hypothetical protein